MDQVRSVKAGVAAVLPCCTASDADVGAPTTAKPRTPPPSPLSWPLLASAGAVNPEPRSRPVTLLVSLATIDMVTN